MIDAKFKFKHGLIIFELELNEKKETIGHMPEGTFTFNTSSQL